MPDPSHHRADDTAINNLIRKGKFFEWKTGLFDQSVENLAYSL